MGLAKYYEDNYNLWCNRLFPISNRKCESEVVFARSAQSIPSRFIVPDVQEMTTPVHYEDRQLVCWTCGKKFLFSARSQKYFASKKWERPKRCKCCREARNIRYAMCASF